MHEFVLDVIKKYRTNNPFAIAQYLNVKVTSETLGQEPKGMLVQHHNKAYIILDSALSHPQRDIVMSHELGHHLLQHQGTTLYELHNIDNNNIQEYEANLFALLLTTHTCLRCEPCLIDGIRYHHSLSNADILQLLQFIVTHKDVEKGIF